MFNKVFNTHTKIINLWLISILCMMGASHFHHWETVQPISWINSSLFFFLFLQSLFIFRKEVAHQSLFINIAIWTFLSSIQLANAFLGPGYALGGTVKLVYEIMYSRQIIMPILATHVIINLVLSVSFREWRPWVCTGASLAVTGSVAVFLFRDILFHSALFDTKSEIISGQTLKLFFLPFLALLGYWGYQFRRDPPISEHIKVLLGFFFVYLVIEFTDLFSIVQEIKVYAVSQGVLLSVLLFLMVIFFNRLNYISSEFGQYFERLLVSGGGAGIRILHKESHNLKPALSFLQTYFFKKPAYGATAFMSLVLFMSYIKMPESAMVNLTAIAFAFLLLFIYWWGLSRKRDVEHNVIKFNQ